MPNRIWVDVEDLFQYAAFNTRPSGIQRIEFELCRALAVMPEARDRVGFVRHATTQGGFEAIPFAEVDALHARLTSAAAPVAKPSVDAPQPSTGGARGLGRRIAYRVPLDVRGPLIALGKAQAQSLRAAGQLTGASLGWLRRTRPARRRPSPAPAAGGVAADGLTVAPFAGTVAPGDVLLVLGSTWFHPFYGELVARARTTLQMRVAVLVYDIIPLLRPEWCQQNLVERFEIWARTLLPQADILLTISQASARDLVRLGERSGLALRSVPVPIPLGTGFSRAGGAGGAATRTDRLPPPRSYVLMVSTIEARKNHALLFRVWRRLLDEMPAAQVPTLVFAGKVGWLVEDLMQQLRNARHLDGKVVVIEDAQDGELEALYRGCLFTVFPSFYEGWGLPVTESFSFGRPCITSSASALPEAGGRLARTFDPENGGEAFRMIRDAVADPADVEAWAARVVAEFRPVSWEESARQVLRALDRGQPLAPARLAAHASDALQPADRNPPA